MHLLLHGVLLLGALAGGAIAQAVGMRRALLIGAIGVLLSTMWLVFSPVRRLREVPHAVVEIRARAPFPGEPASITARASGNCFPRNLRMKRLTL